MTKLLDEAMATASTLPPAVQDEIARMVLEMTGDDRSAYVYSAEEEARLDESEAQASRGEFATDEQVRNIWAKHGL